MSGEKNIIEQIKQVDSTLIQGDKNIVVNIQELTINSGDERPHRKKEFYYFPRRRINEISCDRKEIMQIFRSYFDHDFKVNPAPFYFFTLPSFPEQQANSLIERMTYELFEAGHGDRKVFYLQDNDNFKFIEVPMGINDKNNKYAFRQKICASLSLSFPPNSPVSENNFMLKDLKSFSTALEDYHFVTFAFKLNAEELKKKYVLEFIEWFVTEFSIRSDNSPVFIFFLQLEVPPPRIEGFRKFFPFYNKDSKINPALLTLESLKTKSKNFIMLPFLDSINLREVSEYLSHHIPNDIERYDMIKRKP